MTQKIRLVRTQNIFEEFSKEERKKAKEILQDYGKCDVCMKFKKEVRLSERESTRGYEWYVCDKCVLQCEGCLQDYLPCDQYCHNDCQIIVPSKAKTILDFSHMPIGNQELIPDYHTQLPDETFPPQTDGFVKASELLSP